MPLVEAVPLVRFCEAVGAKTLLVAITVLPGGGVPLRVPPPPRAGEGVGGVEAVDCGSVPRGVCDEDGLPPAAAAAAPGV